MSLSTKPCHYGFTLVELAIVLIIVTLLTGGLLMSVTTQRDNIAAAETQRLLVNAQDALIGFAAANGRLPCPASPGSKGTENPAGGNCINPWDGFLPAITLSLTPSDANGYALDGWGNPIRYALTTDNAAGLCATPCFSTTNGIKTAWNTSVGALQLAPDLRVCSTSTGKTGGAAADCAVGNELTKNGVAIIFSRGKNGAATPTSADEIANGDADRLFVSHTPTPAGANEFDDLVIWLSPNILYNKMIAAGRLP